MTKEKSSGFVYIWFDRKHKRYYIGSHWGSPDDGYICSSSWMKQAYRRRPEDFKRRVISIEKTRGILLERERSWLNLIPDNELGKRYYNLSKGAGHWSADSEKTKGIRQKMCEARQRRIIRENILIDMGISVRNPLSEEAIKKRQEDGYKGGLIGGNITKERGIGLFGMTPEKVIESASKGGRRTAELGKMPSQQKIICPHCKKQGSIPNMRRYHFDHCPHKTI